MRFLTIILLFLCFTGYSQPPGYLRIKGDGYFLKDANGKIITTESGGLLAVVNADTATSNLVLPPDTIQVFNITMVNPGDESSPPLATGVQAYWSFEETSGSTAYDSAASYDGTLVNTPTQSATGISNLCYSFASASSEYVDFGTSFWDVGTDDLSVSLWFMITGPTGAGGLIGNYGTAPWYYIRAQSSQKAVASVYFAGGSIETRTNAILSNDIWYHMVYQLDRDGTTKLYLNNVLQTDQDDISAHSAVSLSNSNTYAIGRIGNDLAGYYHEGLIDEISVVDKLYSEEEISNLYNVGVGKFWPYGVSGGDTLNMTTLGYDPRGDSVRIIVNPIGAGRSTSRTDGTLLFAFNMADSADYNDTTFLWPYLKDTTYIIEAYTGLDDVWTPDPNYTTVFIDSSDIYPPIQDVGVWDTIFSQDFEHHTGLPLRYTSPPYSPDLQTPDWNNHWWFASEKYIYPACFEGIYPDSLVVDPLTGSNVMKNSWGTYECGGYDAQGPARCGESFDMPLGGNYHEVYVSQNIQFDQNFDWAGGGKMGIGVKGGPYDHSWGCPPEYGEGFTTQLMWHWGIRDGHPYFYTYYPGMNCPYGDYFGFEAFQPEGEGMNYYDGSGVDQYGTNEGLFYFDVTSPKWYNITIRVVCNTFTGSTSDNNAIMEGYVNGRLVARHSGLHLLDYPLIDTQIDQLMFWLFNGGGWAADHEQWVYIDDVITFTYDISVDVPRGQELSDPGRVLNLPNWPKID